MLKFQVLCLFAMVFVSGNHLSGHPGIDSISTAYHLHHDPVVANMTWTTNTSVDGQFPRFGGFPGFGVPRFPPFGGPFRPLPGAFGGGFGSDFPAFRGPPIELRPPTGPPRGPPTGPADFDRIRAENGGLPVFGGAGTDREDGTRAFDGWDGDPAKLGIDSFSSQISPSRLESVHNQEQQSTAVVNYGGTNPRETTVQTTRVVLRPSPIDLVRRQASENTISSEIRNGTSVKNVKTRPQNTQRESQSNRNSRRIAGLPSKLRDYRFLQGLRLMAEANTGGVGGVFGQQSMSGGGGQFSDPVTGQPIQVVSSDMANAVRQARTGGDQRMAGTGRTFPLGQGQDFQQFGRTFGGQGVGPQGQMPVGPMGPVGPQGSADQFGRFGAQGGFVADQFGAQGQGQIGVPGGPAMMRPGGPMRIRIPADGSQPIVTRDGVSQPLPQGMTLSDLGISVPPSVNNNVNGGFVQGGSFRNDQRLIGQSGIVQSATSISAGQAAAGIDHSHSNANNLNNMNNMNNMNNNANVGVGTAGGGPDLVVLQIEDLRRDNLPAIMRALSNIAGAQPDPVQGTRGVI